MDVVKKAGAQGRPLLPGGLAYNEDWNLDLVK